VRIVVIGGRGHIGSFLVPRLVRAGHEVVNLSRGRRAPYADDPAWDSVQQVVVDRDAEDAVGEFAARVANLTPEAVIDLICFTPESATSLVAGLRGRTEHLLHCGSIWRYGPSRKQPMTEQDNSPPVGEYGVAKAAIAELLAEETRSGGLVTTTVHPGHISGPGWPPIGPLSNLDPQVWRHLAGGEELAVPGLGVELLHHVHADDVAQACQLAVQHRAAAAGQDFNVVAPSALTVRGFAEVAAGWFGRPARLRSVSWEEFRATTSPAYADQSWQHLWRSQCASIDKARSLLGFAPAYEPEDAVLESVRWLLEHDQLKVSSPLRV
jgi:nucleoside-diphosphate-sugar epimerase